MKRYGASRVHLLAHLIALLVAAWALLQVLDLSTAGRVVLWLAGAIVVHDFVLLPFYAGIDRLAARALPGPTVNYVRVPAGLSLLLGLVYFGEISGRADVAYHRASGTQFQSPLAHWLLASAALFVIAAVVWAVRQSPGSRS